MARILIIEDDEMMSKMVAQAIQNQGHETIQAADGDEGLRLFRENPTDVVITDILMPEKEGIATIHELKREFPDAKIIAVSGGGFTGKDYLPMAKDLGADYTFPKPFRIEELIQALNELLAK